jgi:cytochrome c oxidase assembly protein subunit 15
MAHRLGACVLLGAAVFLIVKTRGSPLARFGILWLTLIVVQAVLGAATVLTNKAADIATLHVVIGALVLVSVSLAAVCATRARSFGVHPSGCSEPEDTLKRGHSTAAGRTPALPSEAPARRALIS